MREIFRFDPLYFELVWGGNQLRDFFHRRIPEHLQGPIGESWELVDRHDAQSRELNTGQTLHELWNDARVEVFGTRAPRVERFPLLIKVIDAAEALSLQVHPPETVAKKLGGEPKTEVWYFLRTAPGAKIYAGFSRSVSPEQFAEAARNFRTRGMYHEIPTHPRDAMFLPSGRVHAIGAGNLLLEVQQNSNTTYRIDDWGRLGLDGKPRELHLEQALQCINFSDVRPAIRRTDNGLIVNCPYFCVRSLEITDTTNLPVVEESFLHVFVETGKIDLRGESLEPGESALLPAAAGPARVRAQGSGARLILTSWCCDQFPLNTLA